MVFGWGRRWGYEQDKREQHPGRPGKSRPQGADKSTDKEKWFEQNGGAIKSSSELLPLRCDGSSGANTNSNVRKARSLVATETGRAAGVGGKGR